MLIRTTINPRWCEPLLPGKIYLNNIDIIFLIKVKNFEVILARLDVCSYPGFFRDLDKLVSAERPLRPGAAVLLVELLELVLSIIIIITNVIDANLVPTN